MKTWCCKGAVRLILFGLIIMGYVTVIALAQNDDDPMTGRIIYIDPARPLGKLKVKQKKREKPTDATVGMLVRRGYMLILDPKAKATVFCADGKRHDLIPGPQGCPCATAKRGFIYNDSIIPGSRGQDSARGNFPFILSPRKTLLLTTRPTIRWSPVTSPTPESSVIYRVSIYIEGRELVWNRDVISKTEIAYPEGVKGLIRGEFYKVVVEAGKASSEQERKANLGFTVLTNAEAQSISDSEEAILRLNLPASETQFLIANLYAAQGLFSEAIEKLARLTNTLKEPAVLRMLGDLYATSGLHREAVKEYESALALPQIKSDIEGQALTFAALGRSYMELENSKQSGLHFNRAVEAFRKLGDTVTVEQLINGKQK
jgi:hypothetical protein